MFNIHDILISIFGETPQEENILEAVAFSRNYRLAPLLIIPAYLFGTIPYLLLQSRLPEDNPSLQLLCAISPFAVFAFGAALLALLPIARETGWKSALNIPSGKLPWKQYLQDCLKLLLLIYPLTLVLCAILTKISQFLGVKLTQDSISALAGDSPSAVFLLLCFLLTCILTPIYEEILFRLIVYQAIFSHTHRWAALLTSLIFAYCHGYLQQFLPLAILALCLQRFCRQGGLPKAILLHSLYNLANFLLLLVTIL